MKTKSIKIEITDIVEHEDGSATYTFEINDEAKKFVKEFYSRKRFTTKLFEKFVFEAIENTLKKLEE